MCIGIYAKAYLMCAEEKKKAEESMLLTIVIELVSRLRGDDGEEETSCSMLAFRRMDYIYFAHTSSLVGAP